MFALFILDGLTREPKIVLESERFPGFFVERVKMVFLEFCVGNAMGGWPIRAEFILLMLVEIIEIDTLVSKRRRGIVVDIIIHHY